ncbi:glycosyltransferase [Amylibacter sp.]|nr:glycosyltransferase [Amylibacter sp.]
MTFYKKNYFTKNMVRFCFNRASRVIVLSESLRNELRDLGYKGIVSIANTVMDDITPQASNKLNNEIVMISNYHVDKGFYIILDALKILKDLGREWNVSFFGDGDPSEFEKYANELGVQSFCNFSKPIFGMAKAQTIAASKILVLPSFNEGQPLVILEAMQLSTLIIASKVGYIKETLGKDYPFIIEPGNPLILAECIDVVMSTPHHRYYVRYLNDRFHTYFSKDAFEKNINSLFEWPEA